MKTGDRSRRRPRQRRIRRRQRCCRQRAFSGEKEEEEETWRGEINDDGSAASAVRSVDRSRFVYLAACRCRATAAAPSQSPSAWSTRSHDPGSPTGREPPDLRGPSARRERSPHRTALTDRQRFNTTVLQVTFFRGLKH